MKNLFKSLVAGALLLAGASASAGTLYWQVTGAEADFDEAWLVAEAKEGGALTYIDGVDSQSDKRSTALTQSDISAYEGDGYLFYVEMSNYANNEYTTVATGYKYGYGDLVSSGYVAANPMDVTSAQAKASQVNLGSGSPVPEPSSGLLLLIGGAMLALRRRRQK